jgi:hypothetical protein
VNNNNIDSREPHPQRGAAVMDGKMDEEASQQKLDWLWYTKLLDSYFHIEYLRKKVMCTPPGYSYKTVCTRD